MICNSRFIMVLDLDELSPKHVKKILTLCKGTPIGMVEGNLVLDTVPSKTLTDEEAIKLLKENLAEGNEEYPD